MDRDDIRPRPEDLPPELRSARVRCRCEMEDGAATDLLLRDGRLRVAEDEGSPDVYLRRVPGNLGDVLGGRLNLLTALMRGDIEVEGPLEAVGHLVTFTRYARGSEMKT